MTIQNNEFVDVCAQLAMLSKRQYLPLAAWDASRLESWLIHLSLPSRVRTRALLWSAYHNAFIVTQAEATIDLS
jgi:hypothetical protein